METQTIAPKVQQATINLKESIAKATDEVRKSQLYPERKDEILGEIEKVSFVVDTLMIENNLEELEKCLTYIETLRINIPNWEGRGVDFKEMIIEDVD